MHSAAQHDPLRLQPLEVPVSGSFAFSQETNFPRVILGRAKARGREQSGGDSTNEALHSANRVLGLLY